MLLLVGGCSPLVRVQVELAVPGIAAPDPARLHVRGRVACNPFDLSKPRATPPAAPSLGLEESRTEPTPAQVGERVVFEREGMIARAEFSATRCHVAISAFYDTNGDQIVGPGDFAATLPATEVADLGWRAGNMNDLGTVVLTAL